MTYPETSIAIIIPVFNGSDYLQKCIESVLVQTYTKFEVFIRDDGSTDTSLQIIKGFTDPRIHVIRGNSNIGLFSNANLLLRMTHAPLVRVLCQDDILEPNCLEVEVNFFAQHPEIGMSYCKAQVIDRSGSVVDAWPLNDIPAVMSPELSLQLFYYHGCIVGNLSNGCIRRSVLEQVGLFDEQFRVAGDYEMWVRICREYPLGVIHKYVLRVRRHRRQLSLAKTSGIAAINESRKIRSSILPLLAPTIRGYARRYSHMRHDVLDTHYALRRLLVGDIRTFIIVVCVIGRENFLWGCLFWILTADNRLFHPMPHFVAETNTNRNC